MTRIAQRLVQQILHPFDLLSYAAYSAAVSGPADALALELPQQVRRILIISPHQDDETLGCGGFIQRFGPSRCIQVAFITDGRGRPHRTELARLALAAERKREARAVCAALHIEAPLFLDFEDGTTLEHHALTQALEKLVDDFRPDLIMAPFGTDSHPDHIAATRALAAVSVESLRETQLLLYQVHSQIPAHFLNRYLGLTPPEHAAKEAALRLYVTQDMLSGLTLSKYLLLSRMAPQGCKQPGVASVEYFASLDTGQLRALCRRLEGLDAARIRSVTTSPYSFRVYLRNKWALDELRR